MTNELTNRLIRTMGETWISKTDLLANLEYLASIFKEKQMPRTAEAFLALADEIREHEI